MVAFNMQKVQITMIHDLVCSWCPIGYNNLKSAIQNLNIAADFKFLPFELNPTMGDKGEAIASYFSRQLNWSEHKLLTYQASLIKTAANAGVAIDFSKRTHYYNTYKGHLLMHWSARFNKQMALNEKLISAYFEHGQDISNTDILLEIATQVGLERAAARRALTSNQLHHELNNKFDRVSAIEISTIPAVIIDNHAVISGSHSVDYFEAVLASIVNETIN